MIVDDDDYKTYYVMDDASVRAMVGQVGAALDMANEALKNVPEEQRQEIERLMKERGMPGMPGATAGEQERSKSEIRRTGERGTENGYPCVKYEVWQNGRKIHELWVTDWGNVEGGDEAQDAFRAMAAFFQSMMDSLPRMPGAEDPFGGADSWTQNFQNGFPVVTIGYGEDGGIEDESSLRSGRRLRIDPDAFEPPSGYKRMSMGPQ